MLTHSHQAIILIAIVVQADDTGTGNATYGSAGFVLLLAALLALPISFGLAWLYRRGILKSMRTGADTRPPQFVPPEDSTLLNQLGQTVPEISVVDYDVTIATGAGAETLYSKLLRDPWRTATVYAVAGACYALVMSAAFLVSANLGVLPLRFLMLFWIFGWPVVLTVALVAATTWRAKLAIVSVYFLVLVILSTIALVRSPTLEWTQIVALWLVTNAVMLVFLNHKTRAVRPLVMIAMIGVVASLNFALLTVGNDEGVIRYIAKFGLALGLGALGAFTLSLILGFVAFGAAAMLGIRWIMRRYVRKKVSDQIITLDALWL